MDAQLAELTSRCDDVFIKVGDLSILLSATRFVPATNGRTLERTHKCDDMTIASESETPSFQCRPVIDPPVE